MDYLRTTLPRAFTQAQQDEWVIFGLAKPKLPELPEITEITTGAWFVEGPSLHFILANHREGVTMPSIHELVWEDPLHMIAGPLYEFAPKPHQNKQKENVGFRSFVSSDPPELILSYQDLLLEPSDRETVSQPGKNATDSSSSSPVPATSAPLSLEERLQRLKRLKEQGLITDDEYQAKRKVLLEGL
ncbi:SHOCT domain-containing protein [Petrachloros mirabilis]